MSDPQYKNFPFLMTSKGISARPADDTLPEGMYLNAENCEELAENAWGPRLGSVIVNKLGGLGNACFPIPGTIVSLGKLGALAGPGWRYAVGSTGTLNRRSASGVGAYVQIASGLSGNPVWLQSYQSLLSSSPTMFIADSKAMLKDTGTLSSPFQMGVFQPQFPVLAQTQPPLAFAYLDPAPGGATIPTSQSQSIATTSEGNFSFNGSQYEFNSGQIRTAGGVGPGVVTDYVICTGFGFTIPSGATIRGIKVDLNWNGQSPGTGIVTGVSLYNLGSQIGSIKNPGTPNQVAATDLIQGGGTDDWGAGPTPTIVNSSTFGFGVQITTQESGGSDRSFINSMAITVYYTTGVPSGNTYSTTGITSFTADYILQSTNTTEAIVQTGIQQVSVGNPSALGQFQFVVVDTGASAETVIVLQVTATGFIANFNKLHATGVTVQELGLSGVVSGQSTGILNAAFPGKPISTWPTTLSLSDYIGLWLYISDQTQVQSITLKFDCGDGTFNTDYFYKVIGQGALQQLLNANVDPTTAATDAVLSESLGLYGNSAGSVIPLNQGQSIWTPLLAQLSDFASSGRADFNDPVFNWQNVNGYQITIVVNGTSSILFELASMLAFGGAGPDTLGGVAYDYMFTLYNANDGTESNPSMEMSNVNPPNQTNWVYPRRQPVIISCNLQTYGPNGPLQDTQITHIRCYRRGGTLGDNFRRFAEVPVTVTPANTVEVEDLVSDADLAGADIISFTNDVPVTSSLVNPVNTTLGIAIPGTNAVQNVYPATMANISVRQQVLLGNPTNPANNFETVVVQQVFTDHFTAFVQNTHTAGEQVQATAFYGQPVTIMAQAYDQMWFAGAPNNPSVLYWSAKSNAQAVSSAANIPISTPDDPITAIVQFKGNLYVSTLKFWWAIAPGSNANSSPTVYPTAAKHGCVAPFGFIVTEEGIYYQAIDGIRFFAGGASTYLTQEIEFLFQGVGSSPIVQANQSLLPQTVAAYWNSMMFFSYVGMDGQRHRVIAHSQYKRWRNDDFDCQSIFLEADTNTLVVGDSLGMVHLDRQNIGYDEGITSRAFPSLVQAPIAMNLQTPFNFMGTPANPKQIQNLQLDVNTNGANLSVTLIFDDGESSLSLGAISNTQRGKINLPLNSGLGVQAYKVSLQITANVLVQPYIYQAALESTVLPITRKSIDTYQLRLGTDESKFAKNIWWEYSASEPINFEVYYDDSSTPGFTFTLPAYSGIRNAMRTRLPAILFRMVRIVGQSAGDFQIWQDSMIEYKPQPTGKGYQRVQFVPN